MCRLYNMAHRVLKPPHSQDYNMLVGLCSKDGLQYRSVAWGCIREMRQRGLEPNLITYNSLIKVGAAAKSPTQVRTHPKPRSQSGSQLTTRTTRTTRTTAGSAGAPADA